jgi:uncharacterized membrane protein
MRLGELIPIPLGIVVFALALTVVGYGTVAFILLALLAIAALVTVGLFARTPLLRYELIVAALVGMGLAIGAAVDIVTVRGDIGRMNTVFKFYLQAWILMGLASGYIAWRFAESGNLNFRLSKPFRSVWVAGLSILAIGVLIYPVMGTRVRLRDRYQTTDQGLDGLAYMLTATQWEDSQPISLRFDLAAIKWLQKNIDGSPVIVEGITGLYHWGNRISINTGLPAIVGWDWHQRQQRVGYADEVMLRRRHVDRIYSTNDPLDAQQLMQEYDARYLVVGQLERITYPAPGLAKFEEMAEQGVMPIYRDDEVTIYRIAAPD